VSTKKWNLVIDVAACNNCHNCFIACKDEHVGNDIPGYAAPQPLHGHRWIDIKTKERGHAPILDAAHLPTMCNHCDNAPCVAAGRGAVRKREDGIVIIDPELAKGRRDLVESCPYGAIWWNEELQLPQTWIFDAHLLDRGWSAPRCVQACPTGAMRALKVSDEEMQAIVKAENLEVLHPEFGTRPRVYYKNLHRYTKLFIGGDVCAEHKGVVDCVAGATVELRQGDRLLSAVTDVFGEFKIDKLEPHSGEWVLLIAREGYQSMRRAITLQGDSVVLEDIRLVPAAA
jgi:Fe-S-cluster-containing dehydrogenase component